MTEQPRPPEELIDEVHELLAEGEYDAALALGAAALSELEAQPASDAALLARALGAVAAAHHYCGNIDRAGELGARAAAAWQQLADPEPGELGGLLHLQAMMQLNEQALDKALPLLERAAELLEMAGAPRRADFCAVLLTMAEVGMATSDPDAAVGLYQRVLDHLSELEPSSEQQAAILNALTAKAFLGLGGASAQQGATAEAKDFLARSIEFFDAAYGYAHPEMAEALGEVAAIYRLIGDEDAAAAVDEELAIVTRMIEQTS